MLPPIVSRDQELLRSRCVGCQRGPGELHTREVLQHPRVGHRGECIVAPGERPVVGDQHAGDVLRNDPSPKPAKGLHDHQARITLVLTFHLLVSEWARHRDVPTEVVGVRRAHAGNGLPSLRERGGVRRVRVGDAAARERPIQLEVRRRIRRGTQLAREHAARLEGHGHQVCRRQVLVGHAARLDDEQARRAVDGRHVAERLGDEAALNQRLVRPVNALPQRGSDPGHAETRSRRASSRFISAGSSARAPGTAPNVSCSSRYSA